MKNRWGSCHQCVGSAVLHDACMDGCCMCCLQHRAAHTAQRDTHPQRAGNYCGRAAARRGCQLLLCPEPGWEAAWAGAPPSPLLLSRKVSSPSSGV